ncbi:hypothetical protein WR25_04884 [Diploscapter pachys]|uniref:protein-histidine N-methyltransferase n=1 Tax=Diploscapter pachys TaxID=2018661 RepID=A0A2A2L1M6_9BILA|nr:hypothetical protein WR25_04884 [Diploscapter pachys]
MGNPENGRRAEGDQQRLQADLMKQVGGLFENFLSKPPPPNIVDLWKEHERIRGHLNEICKIQSEMNASNDSKVERSPELLSAFIAWADQIGIQRNGVDVIESSDVGGYGLTANKSISKNTVVVSVPRHAMMSLDLAKKSSMMKKAFEQDPIVQRMENVALALFLCCHRLKSDSKWKAYINMLPRQFSSPLYFTDEDMLKLKPSPVFEEAMLFYRTVARQFTVFFLTVSRNEAFEKARKTSKNSNTEPPILYNTPFTMSNFTFDLYRWAVCCVTTRINMIPSETDKTKDGDVKLIPALIPVLDMANHEFVNEIIDEAVAFNTESDTAEIVAARGYESNKPVNIFYGRRSNAEHLLHNGFVPEGHNSADRYKLKIGLPRTDKNFQQKHKMIFDLGFAGWYESNIFMFDLANNIKSEQILLAALKFLKVRFELLEKTYGEIKAGQNSIEKNIERLKLGELAILNRAKNYCEEYEKAILNPTKSPTKKPTEHVSRSLAKKSAEV